MTIADLNQEARDLVDADTTSYTAATLLRRINAAYEDVVSYILGCDGLWQFDDTNYSDFPIGTTTLVVGQRDYTFDTTHLEIERVAVLHASDGKYHFISPFDSVSIHDPVETIYQTNGLPSMYDKQGKSVVLNIPPSASDVTLAAGLKIYFKRTADLFTSAQVTTGTKQPGFASPFHVILAYKAALPYAQSYKKDRVPMILAEIQRIQTEMKKHYGRREQDRRKVMSMEGISFR